MKILVVNAGSSSIKTEVFDEKLNALLAADIDQIGGEGSLSCGGQSHTTPSRDHAHALDLILAALSAQGMPLSEMTAAGHRVVHGGERLTTPVRLTPETIAEIATCEPLAPLHNPNNLKGIHALANLRPDLPQCASFDTAFHASNPDVATRYALPDTEATAGIRRYGFHGQSYAGMVAGFGADLPERLLALHLGNGASLCAIHRGQSVATSMGYSPLSGLTMGTRTGDIDGMAVLKIAKRTDPKTADILLNKHSGLKGLAGESDMRGLLARDDDAARFAVDHFCYWAARNAGSAIVAMGGLDAIAFTGGIGENAAPVRDGILRHLAFLGDVPVHIIKAEEEKQIARDTRALMAQA